jgi:hypothetical protein
VIPYALACHGAFSPRLIECSSPVRTFSQKRGLHSNANSCDKLPPPAPRSKMNPRIFIPDGRRVGLSTLPSTLAARTHTENVEAVCRVKVPRGPAHDVDQNCPLTGSSTSSRLNMSGSQARDYFCARGKRTALTFAHVRKLRKNLHSAYREEPTTLALARDKVRGIDRDVIGV